MNGEFDPIVIHFEDDDLNEVYREIIFANKDERLKWEILGNNHRRDYHNGM